MTSARWVRRLGRTPVPVLTRVANTDALRLNGPTNSEGESRRLLEDYRRPVQTQAMLARELGLSPAARLSIKATSTHVALDVVGRMSETAEVESADDGAGGEDDG